MKDDMKKATYTLWNGNDIVAEYPHTREGYDAAFARAFELGSGASIYSSRDDLVWSAADSEEPVTSVEMAEMDAIYSECDSYDIFE
tara:strand:- start:20 stop:277 length:258 start_codon:yes stop_codon:yes gene_type:complete